MSDRHPIAVHDRGQAHHRARDGEWIVFLPWAGSAPKLLGAADAAAGRAVAPDALFVFADGRLEHPRFADVHTLARHCLDDGDGVLRGVAGEFTLIAYDARGQRGIAVRDPLGARPLFYAVVRDGVLLARSIDALLAHPEVPRAPNRAALADHLSRRWPDSGETFYAAVRRVSPGHALRIDGRSHRVTRYFILSRRRRAPRRWADEAQAGQLNELLEKAIARTAGGAQTGIFLSGGLDSVTVAAIAADLCRGHGLPAPLALSLVFPHADCDEEFVQRRVARHLGLPHSVRELEAATGGGDLLGSALALAAHWPAPLLNFWLPAYLSLAREAYSRECVTVLTGGGGDEWLNVGPFIAADLLARGDVAAIYRLWRAAARSTHLSASRYAARLGWTFGLRPHASQLAARSLGAAAPGLLRAWRHHRIGRATPRWVAPDPSLGGELCARSETVPPFAKGPFGFYFREMQAGLDHTLTSMEMEEWDEASLRSGVTVAQPFWDAAVVELLHRVNPVQLMHDGRSKGLVRSALERRFPKLGFGTQKKVLSSDFYGQRLRAGAPAALAAIGPLQSLADLGIVDGAAALRYLRGVVARNETRSMHHVWTVLALETWARHHF